MQLEPIIAALRERVPLLVNKIGGAAQFKMLPETAQLQVPCAYVIPLDDNPGENLATNSIRQDIADGFAVVVALSNVADEKGQGASKTVHDMRKALWAALLGWEPAAEYGGIVYEGGTLLQIDRARLWYQFEFSATMQIDATDGWKATELGNLPPYEGGTVMVDAIDPSDPNIVPDPAPDGRFEIGFVYPQTGSLPE